MTRLQALEARATERRVPFTAHLELTYGCNLKCTHCFQDRTAVPRARELGLDEWLRAVDRARDAGTFVLTLSGGEAMLSPHFWPIAGHARARGMALRIFTNGLLLTRENVGRLAALNPLAVEVSIFSLDPAKHDAVTRAPGSLTKAIRGLFRLKRAGIPIKVKTPLLAASGDDFVRVRALAQRLGAGVVFDPQIFPRFDGASGPTRCRGDDQALTEYFADPLTVASEARTQEPIGAGRGVCGVGRNFLVVSPEGNVLPCPMLQVSAGNVRETPLDAIWRDSPTFQKLRALHWGDLETCSSCPRSGYCDRCGATALLEDGSFTGPSSRACHVAELRERAWGVEPPAGAPPVKRPRLRVING